MKKVYLARDPVYAEMLKDLLEDAGIQASVQNERTFALQGGVPFGYPSVWVHDEDCDAARTIVAEFERSQKSPPKPETWTCPKCGEQIEGHYKECWKCDAVGKESEESVALTKRSPIAVILLVVAVAALLVGFLGSRGKVLPRRFWGPPARHIGR